MIIPTKKLQNGFDLPVYGLGLWQMGGRYEADASNDAQEVEAIQGALNRGITHIDTAELYGNGHAEELLGSAIQDFDRSTLTIATKVSASHQHPDDLRRSFENSLKRLGTDYVDMYILHRYPEPGTPIEQTMQVLDGLVADGRIKHIGASNMSINRFREAQRHTHNKIVCNQVHYNVQYREMEHYGVLKFCQEEDVMLVAWRPVQKGMLPESSILQELARRYEKTPTQIALNWLISQKNVVTICKTSSVKHLEENLGALGWQLEPSDIERIRSEFPDQRIRSDAVPLNYAADIAE